MATAAGRTAGHNDFQPLAMRRVSVASAAWNCG